MKPVLLVNNGTYEPICVISWQDAMCHLFTETVDPIEYYEDIKIRTVNSEFKLPSVVALKKYVFSHRRKNKLTKKNIFIRDNYICCYCGKKLYRDVATVDHVIPSSKGGRNSWDNVVTACGRCNKKKGSRNLSDLGWKMLYTPRKIEQNDFIRVYVDKDEHKHWSKYLN